ncbi:MAG TPA: hypothetical protein VF403_04905 [Kofleriaceae bacterium]
MRKHMRLEYRLRDDVDIDGYLPLLTEFVTNLRKDDTTTDYTAYRDAKNPQHFVHVGHFNEDVAAAFQNQVWFKTFTTRLRELTVSPPDVVMLSPVI